MEFFELVERRHSVRSFTGEPVEQAAITRILKAALSAPSAKNTRSSSFMVVEEPELIGRPALHSYRLEFVHPLRGEKLCIKAELPQDMQKLLSRH